MPTRRFEQITLDQILLSGCAIVFGACILIQHAQAQPGYVPPPTPLPPPVFNPSNPGTMPQPPYTPITPTTPSAVPGNVVTSPTIEGLPENGRSLSPTDISRNAAHGPPPGPLHSRSSSAGVLFLLLRAVRVWLWLCVATGMGRLLVPHVALFVTKKPCFPLKNRGRRHRPAKQRASFR